MKRIQQKELVEWVAQESNTMAIDVVNVHFVVNIMEAAEQLTDEEFEMMQELIKKVDILSKDDEEYTVIPKKQCPTLFSFIKELNKKSSDD